MGEFDVASGSDGNYIIYLNAADTGNSVQISINNNGGFNADPSWIYPASIDTFFQDSLVNENLAFTAATRFIEGMVINEKNQAVSGLDISYGSGNNNSSSIVTDSHGMFVAGVAPGNYWFNLQSDTYLMDQNNATVNPSDDTVKVTINLLTTDTVVSGHVKDDSLVLGKNSDLELNVNGNYLTQQYGGHYNIQAAGPYSARVSSAINDYNLNFQANNFPKNYYIYPTSFSNVVPGKTGCDIAILKGAATISGVVFGDSTKQNTVQYCSINITDSAKSLYFAVNADQNGNFNQPVPNGTYMISFGGYSNALNQSISGSAGPIVIAGHDTSLTLVGTPYNQEGVKRNLLTKYEFGFSIIRMQGFIGFSFSMPIEGIVRIRLYDLRGHLVNTVINGKSQAGSYLMNWTSQSRFFAGKMLIAKLDVFGTKHYTKVSHFMVP